MLQGSEVIIIVLVALIVLGPERLPDMARKMGRWSVELRRAARDLRAGLESEVGDLKKMRSELEEPMNEVRRELRDVNRDVNREIGDASGDVQRLPWVGPEPSSGPTAADAMADLDDIESGTDPDPKA